MGLPFIPPTCYEDDFIDNIWLACAEGNLKLVQYMLSSGQFTVNQQDTSGQTPLHAAVSYDRTETARYLLQMCADVHLQDEDGDTPLHWAESESMARLLVACGAQVSALNNKQQSPLQVARIELRRPVYRYLRRLLRNSSSSSAGTGSLARFYSATGPCPEVDEEQGATATTLMLEEDAGAMHVNTSHHGEEDDTSSSSDDDDDDDDDDDMDDDDDDSMDESQFYDDDDDDDDDDDNVEEEEDEDVEEDNDDDDDGQGDQEIEEDDEGKTSLYL